MLVLFSIVFMRSLGIGGMLVAAISVLVAVTLLPALLSIIRSNINTGRVIPARHLEGPSSGFWHRWSRWVMRRPVILLVASMAFLIAIASPVRYMAAGSPGVDDLSVKSDSRVGVELFSDKWGLGEASPIYVVLETHRACGVFDPGFRGGLAQLGEKLKSDPRVGRVESLAELDLPAEIPCNLQQIGALLRDQPVTASLLASLVNPDGIGDTTLVRIVPAIEPRSPEVKNLVRELRHDLLPGIGGLSGTEMLVGGGPAEAVDFTAALAGSFPYLMAAVLIITFFVLLLLFRSVLLPLKAIFMNLLSVSAAYGVLVLVFQDGWGASLLGFVPPGGILPFVPVILFSVLFGLSMDYEVFLLSRIKEEYERTGDNVEAVAYGLERTGRIITTAALIMIVVFGSFTLTESIVVKEFGVGLAVSIFLDATIVRIILVPATMKLLGDWNWWLPRWLDRILPDFGARH
jgi:RND superfamily putative drug exporter